MSASRNYHLVTQQFLKVGRLMQTNDLLRWDSLQRLPSSSETRQVRASVRRVVQSSIHDILTNRALDGTLMSALQAGVAEKPSANALTPQQHANVSVMRRWREKVLRLENHHHKTENENNFKTQSQAYSAWCETVEGDGQYWQQWADPHFSNLVRICRAEGKRLAAGTHLDSYDAILESWEPGLTCATIDSAIVEPIIQWLPMAVKYGKEQRNSSNTSVPHAVTDEKKMALGYIEASVESQLDFFRTVLLPALGFDATTRGRVDAARTNVTHGEAIDRSTTLQIAPDDVRIIVRCVPNDVMKSILNLLPSVGMALAGQCLPGSGPHPVWGTNGKEGRKLREFVGHPVSRCSSRCMDVAVQQLYAKRLTVESADFRRWLCNSVVFFFNVEDKEATSEALEKRLSQHAQTDKKLPRNALDAYKHTLVPAEQSLLGMAAYELERRLVNGQLEAEHAHVYWTARLAELGLVADDEKSICAIAPSHPLSLMCLSRRWASGTFGMWPVELMGDVYCCQLLCALTKCLSDINADSFPGALGQHQDGEASPKIPPSTTCLNQCLAAGDLQPIREWLHCNVWRHGGFIENGSGVALLKVSTNGNFDATAYGKWLMSNLQ